MAQVCSPLHPLIYYPLRDLRFWGREFRYDESVACIRKGGIIPRKSKSVLKDPNPVASTSTQPEEQESADDEQDEEADEEMVSDESFDADWSGNLMCVADPFIVTRVRVFSSLRLCFLNVHVFQNCAGQIKKLIFTFFIQECRSTEGMLQLGISLESILSREIPAWRNPVGLPKRARKGRKNRTKKDQDKDALDKRVPAQKPKPPGYPNSGVQRGSSNTHQRGRGGKKGAPSRLQANNS